MREKSDSYVEKANKLLHLRDGLRQIITILSLVVILGVFWSLKLTGITMAGDAFCGMAEHVHSEQCLKGTLLCELQEVPAHVHSDACRGKALICGQEESETHTHTDACWQPEAFVCGLEETSGHTHTEECYEILESCPLQEHIHTPDCYSDLSADLETPEIWESGLPQWTGDETITEKLLAVAHSQLGYEESTRNFQVDGNGNRRGITRYGQWYGNPYGDWAAMFASFCLHYSGISDMPANAGPEAMRLEWENADLYGNADAYTPEVGWLLFLDKDGSQSADTVAVITAMDAEQLTVVEGDLENKVVQTHYPLSAQEIMGYGRVPLTPELTFVPQEGAKLIGQTEEFSQELFTDGNHLVVYLGAESGYCALDGKGEPVEITIAPDGRIYTNLETPEQLLWTVTVQEDGSTEIQNLMTGMNLPEKATPQISTLDLQKAAAQLDEYQYARAVDYTVWLDGTNGGIMAYNGSDDTAFTVTGGTAFLLPETWKSPAKYDYVLSGWYDVVNNRYYAPGEEVVINGNTVFYADWAAATYDVGQFNAQVADTVSTNSFITTRMFDYSVLMNVLSEEADVTVNNRSHSETWNLLLRGENPYNNEATLDFILRDWDAGNQDISYPSGHDARNNPTDAGEVYQGLYNDQIRQVFFDPDLKLPGKQYLGTGDHLFQLCLDPNHEHYGYYYYNSERNAASYNQSDQRFYVYDYLECTRTSAGSGNDGKYSDFLPLNSPYANSNGKQVNTYSYEGIEGEYLGTTHYMYDCRYNDSNNSTANVGTNFWFGMQVDVNFYLPNQPGATVNGGGYGNQDIYGKDMHFRFSGDDDVWVLIDGKLVLDLGGLHGMETGDINFATGVVTINGVVDQALSNNLKSLTAGEHTLSLYYMERGSSMSNCAIYFNLAPRFRFSIQKEDVLTRDLLNGAQFSVYTDRECTIPAQLWASKASHDRGDPSTNVFTVIDGVADMWGMGAGNTYYIRETRPPDDTDYGFPNGLIRLSFDSTGTASYHVEILDEGDGISGGFIVHGLRIDAENQQAYIVATNAPKWVKEVTSVQAMKKWDDQLDHTGQSITVYLTVTDPDGTVRRLQEAELSQENNWHAIWENLPKYLEDGTPVRYGVEEAYTSGYYSTVEEVSGEFVISTTKWQNADAFRDGQTYLLKNASGMCLSTQRYAEDTGFMWVSQETAVHSSLAKWTASVKGGTVRLTNLSGQTITLYYGNGNYITDFFAANRQQEDNNWKQYFTFTKSGSGFRLSYNANNKKYFISATLNSSSKFDNTTEQNRALVLTPMTEVTSSDQITIENQGFLVTNTPLEKETSLTVRKYWSYGHLPAGTGHEKAQVTVKLLANGKDTGRTVTLSLKNGWEDTFRGLPYVDENGFVVSYTVEEIWDSEDWLPSYGEVITVNTDPPTYTTTITNTYRWGIGEILPSTGTSARMLYTLCGTGIILLSLVNGWIARRKRERRMR